MIIVFDEGPQVSVGLAGRKGDRIKEVNYKGYERCRVDSLENFAKDFFLKKKYTNSVDISFPMIKKRKPVVITHFILFVDGEQTFVRPIHNVVVSSKGFRPTFAKGDLFIEGICDEDRQY